MPALALQTMGYGVSHSRTHVSPCTVILSEGTAHLHPQRHRGQHIDDEGATEYVVQRHEPMILQAKIPANVNGKALGVPFDQPSLRPWCCKRVESVRGLPPGKGLERKGRNEMFEPAQGFVMGFSYAGCRSPARRECGG